MFSMNELMAIEEALTHRISTPDDEMIIDQDVLPTFQDYRRALSKVKELIESPALERPTAPGMGGGL